MKGLKLRFVTFKVHASLAMAPNELVFMKSPDTKDICAYTSVTT